MKIFNIVWWILLIVIILSGIMSMIYPNYFSEAFKSTCIVLSNFCIDFGYNDKNLLYSLGYEDYSVGFSALRNIGPYLFVLFTASTTIVSISNRRVVVFDKKLILSIVFGFLCFYVSLINKDFYFIESGGRSRFYNPPIGSIVYVSAIIIAAFSLSICISWPIVRRVVRKK